MITHNHRQPESRQTLQLAYETAGTPTYGQKGSPELTSE
jgi:hypothetical protein